MAISNFHFGKDANDDLASFDRLSLDILQFSPVNHQYQFDSVLLVRPFFKYDRYEKLDNLQALFGKNGANIKAAADDPLPAAMFNPYLITYTSFPLDRGTIELTGTWKVRGGIIRSDNHVVIIDPRVTVRRKNKGSTWIPLTLIMSFIREKGNVIDYDIPITGDLKSPKFHLHDVLADLITKFTFLQRGRFGTG